MIVKYIYKTILIGSALLCLNVISYAQYSSTEELKEAAESMFEEKNYEGSLKLYSQLLSTYPKDPNYNYKYGACVLFGSREKESALKFLKFAVTKPTVVDPVAFYFLGKGYHHEYEFSKAIENYTKFKEKSSAKEQKGYNIDREIEMCQNGEKLLKSMADIGVLSKKEIKESDFFRSYKLNGIGGKIIVKPEEFKTKIDTKKGEKSLVYLGQAKDEIIFSSYGKDGSTGKDIYKSVKKANGDWGEAVLFSDKINSQYDEDYPFLHPDGKTLYFSSKGYNSMGGYDVFKSTFNENTSEWSSPENLDFPINTPDDDILYISDMENKLAYFASSRASKQGELTVYNVAVESVPFVHSVIYGFFIAEANPEMKSATITVRAVDKDRKYGEHVTKSETGEYLLMFPTNGGKFKILVETTEDAPVHSAIIEIPELEGFRALKQELRLVGEGNEEKLIVKNLFDESDEFDINNPLVVQNILKERAKMDVNTTEAEVDSIAAVIKDDEITAGNNLSNSLGNSLAESLNKSIYKEFSDEDLVAKTDETAAKIIYQTEISKQNAITSYKIAEEKSIEAKKLYAAFENLMLESESARSESEKKEKIALANNKKMAAAKLVNEMVATLSVAKTLDNEVVERSSDIGKVKLLQSSINTKLGNNERTLAETDLKELDEIASASYHNESALVAEVKIADNNLLVEEKKYEDLNEYVVDLQDRESALTASLKTLEDKRQLTNKKKEIAVLDEQIKSLGIDLEDTQFDLKNAERKAEKGKAPYLKAKSEAATTNSVIAMLNGENISEEKVSEPEKIQLENDIVYFEKEGLVGMYSEETDFSVLSESKSSNDLMAYKDEFKIIDDEGKIVNYNEAYNTQLENDVKNVTNPKEKERIVANIYERWIDDIDEEINIRKRQLAVEADAEKKEEHKITISSLESLKAKKQKEMDLYGDFVEDGVLAIEEEMGESLIDQEPFTKETLEEVKEQPTAYDVKYEAELAEFVLEDTYESSTLKAAVHENWAKDIERDIALKKSNLSAVSGAEKNKIENEIAVLESNLLEQEEFASLYALQAESLKGETSEVTEPVVENEVTEPILDEVIAEEELLTKEIVEEVSEDPASYTEKHTAELANFSGEDTYESSTLKAAVHENWAKDIEGDIALRKSNLSATSGAEKNKIENEIAVLESDLLEQEEFASLYELQAESLQAEPTEVLNPIIVEEVSEEPTNYIGKHTAELANFSGEDTYESSTLKAAVHENWAKDIEGDIALKKSNLSATSGAEKNKIENEIAMLESDLIVQEEFASLYALQAESLQGESSGVTEPIVEEEVAAVEEEITEPVVEKVINEEEPLSKEIMEEVEDPENYTAKHTAALANFIGEDTYESSTLKAAVHENWVKDIEGDIALKKSNLATTSGAEKNKIENEIAVLESDLLEQEEFASLYELQAESLQEEPSEVLNPIIEEEVAVVEDEVTEPVVDEVITEEELFAKEIVEEVLEEPTNYIAKHTAELANFSGEDTYESSTLKAAVHENWAKDIEGDIALKKSNLARTSGAEKNNIENEIAVLESDLIVQEEFASLYALQAESLQGEPSEVLNPIIEDEDEDEDEDEVVTVEKEIIEPLVEKVINEEEQSTSGDLQLLAENLTENNLNGTDDDFSNLKYNNKFNYKSPQSKTTLGSVASLKTEARNIKDEADVKSNEANNATNETDKNRLTLEAEVLYEKSERKQEAIAKVYEAANRNEYYNNQSVVAELKKDNSINPINITIADLMMGEANSYYDEAKLKRSEAENSPNFTTKERLLQQGYELEMKAVEAQKRAIQKMGVKDADALLVDNGNEIVNDENNPIDNEVVEVTTENSTVSDEVKEVEALTLSDKKIISELKGTEIEAVKKEPDYVAYSALKKKKRRLVKEAEVEYVKAEGLESEINDQKALVASLNSIDETAELPAEKTTREYQIKEIEKSIIENETQVLTLRESAQDKENQALEANKQISAVLNGVDEPTANNYVAIERAEEFDNEYISEALLKNVEPDLTEETVTKNSEPTLANIDVIPAVLKESIFVINRNKAVYSDNKRIPVSPKLPEGLVFKVQVGAFKNPIPQDHFKGFAPIVAESAGKGITRYTAGLFKEFNNANEAKGSIRSIGYSDAFVVAFFNGKRINMTQARGMQNGEVNIEEGGLANNTGTTNVINESTGGETNNSSRNNGGSNTVAEEEVKDDLSKDVRNIEGTFFTIQLGVYSKQITSGQLENVSDLNSERIENGLIRYSSGVFKSLNDANAAKEVIRDNGYEEAFVVSYNDGKRVNVAKAIDILGVSVPNSSTTVAKEVQDGISKDVRNIGGTFFTIQVGVYSKQITAGELNNVSPLNSERTASGLIRYTSGVFKTLDDANVAKEKIREKGISDAFVVAYSNGIKTTVANANGQLGLNNPVAPKETTIVEEALDNAEPILEKEVAEEENLEEEEVEEVLEEEKSIEEVEETVPANIAAAKALKIKFKVQLGAYNSGVPVDEAGLFLKLSNRGIKNYVEEGKTIYIMGSFRDYELAIDLKTEMKEMGVKNPKVVAFQKNKEIEVNKALELIENN